MAEQLAKAYLKFVRCRENQEQISVTENAKNRLNGKNAAPPPGNGCVFPVQFNPSELQFSTESGSKKKKNNFQGKGGKISKEDYVSVAIPGIHMSVKLVFDGYFEKEGYVQRVTEGLLAAAKESSRGLITSFSWEKFVFTGILENVSAEYTMFDAEGCPVRSNVDFTVSLTDKKKMAEILETDYQALFS